MSKDHKFKNKQHNLKVTSEMNWQPVGGSNYEGGVVSFIEARQKPSSRILL